MGLWLNIIEKRKNISISWNRICALLSSYGPFVRCWVDILPLIIDTYIYNLVRKENHFLIYLTDQRAQRRSSVNHWKLWLQFTDSDSWRKPYVRWDIYFHNGLGMRCQIQGDFTDGAKCEPIETCFGNTVTLKMGSKVLFGFNFLQSVFTDYNLMIF